MENFDHILLFKTNIKSEEDKQVLEPVLNKLVSIEQWNVDLCDEDCVLRIISYELKHEQIIDLIQHHGYTCCELI